ncbi:hypothetical protein [Microbispora triticiradicis]|uniref:hypothetical protein n=1 Tax=Microbispora triticiradicis TaxID=2200763 RepID=UPI001AD6985D|nr:hypothetical protein [Microbispora triticiradicis]MBO4273354.1 hypothetical protein [Microbispora triticiradicis]
MVRSLLRVRWLTAALIVACVAVFGTTPANAVPHPPPTGVTTAGVYALTTGYNGTVGNTRGWTVTWKIPTLSNGSTAWGAVGQWYYNLESGIYHTPGAWSIYYFGDDNGTTGNNSLCNASLWGTGGTCTGALTGLTAGQELTFIYEWCDSNHSANVNGSLICLYVDLKDGNGRRFLADDSRSTVEMYAHDIEDFSDSGPSYPIPQISCTQPTVMVAQTVKSTSGTWSNMTGSQWNFNDSTPNYKFQNINTSANPATWQSCTG